jgi:hypothetical protein
MLLLFKMVPRNSPVNLSHFNSSPQATEQQVATHLKLAFKNLNVAAKGKKRTRPESWTVLTALKLWRQSKRRKADDGSVASSDEPQEEEDVEDVADVDEHAEPASAMDLDGDADRAAAL